ncbi:MAG: zinc ribbon domain-containing protein [Acidobacteriota bacterium]
MQCSYCGNNLMQDAHFCPGCGRAVVTFQAAPVYAQAPTPMAYSRVLRHVQSLGVMWMIYAIWHFVTKLTGLLFVHAFLGHGHAFSWGPWGSGDFAEAMIPVAIGSLLVSVALSGVTAYALMTRKPWGRICAIVAGILMLIHPILGTALGIYTLWVLAPAASGDDYSALTQTAQRR